MQFQYSYFIQRLRNFSLQNLSNDFFDDVDRVHKINTNILFIFNYMNANGTWYYSNVKQVLTATDTVNGDNTWTLANPLSRIWRIEADFPNPPTGVQKVCSQLLTPNNVHDDLDNNNKNNGFSVAGEITIHTKQKYTSLTVYYQRLPLWADYTDLSQPIDIPYSAIGILEYLVMRSLFPINYEQGASLANNYYQQALESLEIYAKNIGLLSINETFSTPYKSMNEQTGWSRGQNWKKTYG